MDQTGDNKEVRRPPVGLWSSEQAANLGDRPQTLARGEELHFTLDQSPASGLSPLVGGLLEEGEGGYWGMGRHEMVLVMISPNNCGLGRAGCMGRSYSLHSTITSLSLSVRDSSHSRDGPSLIHL